MSKTCRDETFNLVIRWSRVELRLLRQLGFAGSSAPTSTWVRVRMF
jgi:hypothetical protein